MDISAAMDRFVRMTRLGRCAGIDLPPPRNFRWLPLGAIAAIVAGYPMIVLPDNAGIPNRRAIALMIAGMLLFVGGIVLGHFLRVFGPRLTVWVGPHPLDERETMMRARARAASGTILIVAAIGGCYYQAIAVPLGLWRPKSAVAWADLGIGLQGIAAVLPVLTASWMQPRLVEPEEA